MRLMGSGNASMIIIIPTGRACDEVSNINAPLFFADLSDSVRNLNTKFHICSAFPSTLTCQILTHFNDGDITEFLAQPPSDVHAFKNVCTDLPFCQHNDYQ